MSDMLDRLLFDIDQYPHEPPGWFFEYGTRYQQDAADRKRADDVDPSTMIERAALYLVLGWRLRLFVTGAMLCQLFGHVDWIGVDRFGETTDEEHATHSYCNRCGVLWRRDN